MEHCLVMRGKFADAGIQSADKGVNTSTFGALAFRESGAMEVSIAYEPECPNGRPNVLDDLGSPDGAVVVLGVKFFEFGMGVLDTCPFDGAASEEEVSPANGCLGGNETGFIVRERGAVEITGAGCEEGLELL